MRSDGYGGRLSKGHGAVRTSHDCIPDGRLRFPYFMDIYGVCRAQKFRGFVCFLSDFMGTDDTGAFMLLFPDLFRLTEEGEAKEHLKHMFDCDILNALEVWS